MKLAIDPPPIAKGAGVLVTPRPAIVDAGEGFVVPVGQGLGAVALPVAIHGLFRLQTVECPGVVGAFHTGVLPVACPQLIGASGLAAVTDGFVIAVALNMPNGIEEGAEVIG